jgi:hypothetical protein
VHGSAGTCRAGSVRSMCCCGCRSSTGGTGYVFVRQRPSSVCCSVGLVYLLGLVTENVLWLRAACLCLLQWLRSHADMHSTDTLECLLMESYTALADACDAVV